MYVCGWKPIYLFGNIDQINIFPVGINYANCNSFLILMNDEQLRHECTLLDSNALQINYL